MAKTLLILGIEKSGKDDFVLEDCLPFRKDWLRRNRSTVPDLAG
jgi:hypothetical protein